MPNPYFKQGTSGEQNLVESLIVESIEIYGITCYYIPRTLVGKDDILGEDRFSKFEHAYPITMYVENVEGFEGNGAILSKFGLQNEEGATLVVARKRWEQLVGSKNTTIADRPCEGDLIYFPLSNGLFEIKFVEHRNPFYQLGRLYIYKLKVELYRYNSDEFETGIPAIDDIATENTLDVDMDDIREQTPFAANEFITTEGNDLIFSDENPFAEIN